MLWHAVQDPTRTSDQAIAAFFLDARQATQKLVSDVFAQTYFAKALSWDVETLLPNRRFAIRLEIAQLKTRHICVMDLAQVVPNACHLQPLRVGRDHAPAGEVVQGCTPKHGFFAACVHGDVAAYARGFCRGGVYRKNKACALSSIRHTLGDNTRFRPNRGHWVV